MFTITEAIDHIGRNWLQIFAEGDGSGASGAPAAGSVSVASDTGTAGAAGETAAQSTQTDAGQAREARLRELGVPESVLARRRKAAGSRPEELGAAPAAERQPAPEPQPAPDPAARPDITKDEDWKELLKDPHFNDRVQQMVRDRLRSEGKAKDTLEALAPVLQKLAADKGVSIDTSNMAAFDPAAFQKAMERDDSYWQQKAADLGVTEDVAKQLTELQEFQQQAEAKEQEDAARLEFQQHMMKLQEQAMELRQIVPDFDLNRELENEDFVRMTSPMAGLTVQQAYYAVHHDELMAAMGQAAVNQAQQRLANAIRANQTRPQESGADGMQAAPPPVRRYSELTKAERETVKQRIRRAAARGEKVYPTF